MTRPLQEWHTLSSTQVLHTSYLKIRREAVELPNGVVLPDYYIIENRGWVGVVPFTPDGKFVINEQYKHGIGQKVLEFAAGGIDEGEHDPKQTAHRELMEETGYSVEPDKLEFLTEMIVNPTGAETRCWWYLARDVHKTGKQHLDPAETIENFLITPKELLNLIHTGRFNIQGQVDAAYMALERLGFLKLTML